MSTAHSCRSAWRAAPRPGRRHRLDLQLLKDVLPGGVRRPAATALADGLPETVPLRQIRPGHPLRARNNTPLITLR